MNEPTDDPTRDGGGDSPEPPPDGSGDAIADDAVLDELSLVFENDERAGEPDGDAAPDRIAPDDIARGGSEAGGTTSSSAEPAVTSVDPRADDPSPPSSDRPVLVDPGLPALGLHEAADDDAADEGANETAGSDTPAGHTIRIGEDDDLPEIRYLDEELGVAGDAPVFIDDDDGDDAIIASDATDRGVDGRLRQRRISVARAVGRRRLRWLLVGAGVVILVVAALAVLASSLFSVNQITIVGNRYSDPDALKAVIVGLDGTPVLLVDTTAVEEELEAIPWVEDARVRTSFPSSASIEIRERIAVTAMPGADGRTRVLDKAGRVLDLIEGQPIALVWISGPITLDIPAGHFASPGPTWASALVPKLTPTVRPRVESMQVTPDGSDLRLYLRPASPEPDDADGTVGAGTGTGDETGIGDETGTVLVYEGPLIEVRFGSAIGDNEQIEKLVRLERVLDDLGRKPVSVIDVSTAEVTVL